MSGPGRRRSGPSTRFACDARLDGGCVVVEAEGELDLFTCAVLRERVRLALDAAAPRRPLVVFDLERLTFCDLAGLNVFRDVHEQLVRVGGAVAFACVPYAFDQVVRAAGLSGVWLASDSVHDAVFRLAGAGP